MSADLTHSEENYLEAMFHLQQSRPAIRIKDISDLMGVRMASATNAVKKLSRRGMVKSERYGSIELTPDGWLHAQRISNRHSLLETFFTDVLGVDRKVAAEDACKVEHALSKQTVERLLTFLEQGGYINTAQKTIVQRSESAVRSTVRSISSGPEAKSVSLSELTPGQTGTIVEVSATTDETGHLATLGLRPDVQLERVRSLPDTDKVYVRLSGLTLGLSREEADQIRVVPDLGDRSDD